jgi:hypothetical protein
MWELRTTFYQYFDQFSTINVNKFLNWYDLNMYIINVIADDELKIGLYAIYFLNFRWVDFWLSI